MRFPSISINFLQFHTLYIKGKKSATQIGQKTTFNDDRDEA